jgi:plastocyanin
VLLSIPRTTRALANPHANDAGAWRAGADHFGEHCAMCHGNDGHGKTPIASRMYPPVPDLADPAIQRMPDGALFAVIRNGVRWTGMPAFRSEQSEDDTWKLVSFVRRVPALTAKDLEHRQAGASAANTIEMDGTGFVPSELTVTVGETVTWVNRDPFPHNVTSAAGHFSSHDMQPDQQWQFTPQVEGRFPYVCTLHPGMAGTLIVRGKSH